MNRQGRTTLIPGNLGERGWEMGTVEIASEHEIATSAAMPATDMGNWEVL